MFGVDILELGVWSEVDSLPTLAEACLVASSFAELFGEERVRIITPDNQTL